MERKSAEGLDLWVTLTQDKKKAIPHIFTTFSLSLSAGNANFELKDSVLSPA